MARNPERAASAIRGLRAMAAHIPLRRVGLPEEFAAAATFLASERASFITGTVQLVDGGASVTG